MQSTVDRSLVAIPFMQACSSRISSAKLYRYNCTDDNPSVQVISQIEQIMCSVYLSDRNNSRNSRKDHHFFVQLAYWTSLKITTEIKYPVSNN